MPEITVLMSVYNGQKYLRQCIESILSQTNGDFEFLIIDDGSTDSTPSILASYQDPRMKIIRQENCGVTKSLNRGLALAQGTFVARIDADDIAMPDRFEKQFSFLQFNPDVGIVGSNAILIDENGNQIGRLQYPQEHEALVTHAENFRGRFPHSSFFFRVKAVRKLNGYNERYVKALDHDLFFRLCRKYRVACLPESLIALRLHSSSLLHSDNSNLQRKYGVAALINHIRRKQGLEDLSAGTEREWDNFFKAVDHWFDKQGYNKREEAKQWFRKFRTNLRNFNIAEAIRSISLAFQSDPLFFTYKGIGLKVPEDLYKFII